MKDKLYDNNYWISPSYNNSPNLLENKYKWNDIENKSNQFKELIFNLPSDFHLNFSSSQMRYNFHHKLSRKRIKYHRSNIYSNKILLSIKIIYKIITSCILYLLNDDNKWNSLLEIISRSSVIQESTSQKYRRVKISNYLATNVSINLPGFLDYRDQGLEGFRDERRPARAGRELECLL